MKRSQEVLQVPSSHNATPAAKKLKMTPPESPAAAPEAQPTASSSNGVESEWTTVTKKKAKKVKRIEGKLDVGVMAHAHGATRQLTCILTGQSRAIHVQQRRDLEAERGCWCYRASFSFLTGQVD